MPAEVGPVRKLLCVVAHPDDECFAFGGALILAAQRGIETSVLCMTDGQAASNRGEAATGQDLGRMRREEMERSCQIMGVAHHEFLNYGDAKLEFADPHAAARTLVERMRRFRPEVVLTFGLDGGQNAHPDHAMVSTFASLAFHWSGRPQRFPDLQLEAFLPQRLYHASTSFTLPDRAAVLPAPWSVALDISAVKEIKKAAFFAHTSQLPIWEKFKPSWERYGDFEHYTLAAAPEPQEIRSTSSLF